MNRVPELLHRLWMGQSGLAEAGFQRAGIAISSTTYARPRGTGAVKLPIEGEFFVYRCRNRDLARRAASLANHWSTEENERDSVRLKFLQPKIYKALSRTYPLVTTDPARQGVGLELIRWLTASNNLGEWTMAVGMLPTRGKALTQWPDANLRAIAREAVTAAQPMPSPSLLNVLGPPITTAVQDVLAGRSSAEAAASAAAQAIVGR